MHHMGTFQGFQAKADPKISMVLNIISCKMLLSVISHDNVILYDMPPHYLWFFDCYIICFNFLLLNFKLSYLHFILYMIDLFIYKKLK